MTVFECKCECFKCMGGKGYWMSRVQNWWSIYRTPQKIKTLTHQFYKIDTTKGLIK